MRDKVKAALTIIAVIEVVVFTGFDGIYTFHLLNDPDINYFMYALTLFPVIGAIMFFRALFLVSAGNRGGRVYVRQMGIAGFIMVFPFIIFFHLLSKLH